MIVRFKIHRSLDTTDEEFLCALVCSRTSIESVLSDNDPTVTLSDDIISVDVANFTLQQCKEQIKGCFCDSSGDTYTEFKHVEVLK